MELIEEVIGTQTRTKRFRVIHDKGQLGRAGPDNIGGLRLNSP